MRRDLGLLASGLLVLGVSGIPQAANAAEADCPAGSICFWNDPDFSGKIGKLSAKTACAPGNTNSAKNNHATLTVHFYKSADCSGTAYGKLAPGTKVADTEAASIQIL